MIKYKIVRGRLVLDKDGTYFSLTASQIEEVRDIFTHTSVKVMRKKAK